MTSSGEKGDTAQGDEYVKMSQDVTDNIQTLKNKRKSIRGKITRTINRIHEGIAHKSVSCRRVLTELADLKTDYERACDFHGQLYTYADLSEITRLDEWEEQLTNDVHTIEEEAGDYLIAADHDVTPKKTFSSMETSEHTSKSSKGKTQVYASTASTSQSTISQSPHSPEHPSQQSVQHVSQQSGQNASLSQSFDTWIKNLVEFQETELPHSFGDMSIAEAIFKLEASKDIPTVSLGKFNGDPLDYVNFMEKFKIHIHNRPSLSDDGRMIQLQSHVSGEAEKAISGLGSSGTMYPTALKILQEQFGQASTIARAQINKLTKGPKIQSNNRNSLREFSLDLINCIATFKRIDFYSDINANENLRRIVMRLPPRMIDRWKVVASDLRDNGESPSISHISEFVRRRVKADFDPDFGDLEARSEQKQKSSDNPKKRVYSQQPVKRAPRCYICEQEHRISDCPSFLECDVAERMRKVQELRLCFSCPVKGHQTKECKSKKPCAVNNCKRTHNKLLHTDPPVASALSNPLETDSILPVVRVTFRSQNGKLREGNVLIDGGAGTTLIRKDFAKVLGLQGIRERLELSLVGCKTLENANSRCLKFWISSLDGGEEFEIHAYELYRTVPSVHPLDRKWLNSFSHLRDIEFSHKGGPIDLILGVQYSHLHAEDEVRQGLPFEPIAKHSKLGWYVMGPDKTQRASPVYSVNFVEKVDLPKFYEFETLGIQGKNCECPQDVRSRDDQKALYLMKESCHWDGDRYEIGLPWKKDPSLLPDNYQLAEKRLQSLEKSLLKNEDKSRMYAKAIHEYEDKGWAEKIDADQVNTDVRPVYYLPHHGVYRPDKPSTPLRVVFDPACEFKGVSMNSFLYKGPGLLGSLLAILLRFREEKIAIVGDISKMYLQIKLKESDTHLHRFLWRDLDTSRAPDVYRLLRVTFGDKPSPDMASFVMLHIAQKHRQEYPEAATIVERDRYMDDLIHSCETSVQALKRINDVNAILETGKFRVKEWYCSADDVRQTVQTEESMNPSHVIPLDSEEIKTLGVRWNPVTDMLGFVVTNLSTQVYTKRTVLSVMSRLYDPLGLALPVTIKARMAMQDIWRDKSLDWDDQLPDVVCQQWKALFEEIQRLESVQIPRCLKPMEFVGSSTLHVFADASMGAYGAVAYLSWSTPENTSVQLIMAKARVAPLRHTTIPRLELMAALVASCLAKTICDEFKETSKHHTVD